MAARLDKLKRIAAVQAKLHRIEEFRLAEMQRRSAELAREEETLVATFNDDDTFAGVFVAAMARQLRRIAQESTRVETSKATQAGVVRDAALRLKRTERHADRMAQSVRRDDERRLLRELIEALGTPRDDASPV